MELSMIRRITSLLVLVTLVVVQALPVAAGSMVCRMDRPAPTEDCSRCDVAPAENSVPALSAGSCCRFGAAPEVPMAPGTVVMGNRITFDDESLALRCPAIISAHGETAFHASASNSPVRSTSPPPSSTTSLRL
jgi:hypothetical protein